MINKNVNINNDYFDELFVAVKKLKMMSEAYDKSLKDPVELVRENMPNWSDNDINDYLDTLTKEEIENGYSYAIGYGNFPNATCVKRIPELGFYKTDIDAANAYVANGGKLINMEHSDTFYIDDEENRKIILPYLSLKTTTDETDYIKYEPEIGMDKKWKEFCDNLLAAMEKYDKKMY